MKHDSAFNLEETKQREADFDLLSRDSQDDFETSFEEDSSMEGLRREVERLKTQVKYLKKIAILNVFESKEDFRDFFSDIW